jgi:hypothetical protein
MSTSGHQELPSVFGIRSIHLAANGIYEQASAAEFRGTLLALDLVRGDQNWAPILVTPHQKSLAIVTAGRRRSARGASG